MGFIEDELKEVKTLCERVVEGSRLVSCVPTMVRTEIKRTEHKSLVACMQFPVAYPKSPVLLELKSKFLSDKLLQKLMSVCEEEAKKYLGKAQVIKVLQFLRKFIDENPLSCCYDEINELRKSLNAEIDEIRLKQKSSSLVLKVINGGYFLNVKIIVPDHYPLQAIDIHETDTNFPPSFNRHMILQAKEIARQCVEPPRIKNPREPEFKPVPSLGKSCSFLIDCIKRLPNEKCQYCKELCFPKNPNLVIIDENSPRHIERVYCGHLYHQQCLFNYMKAPPFGNKTCHFCGTRISHHKWKLSDRLAEDRWAHEQARERELAEVEDFFK
ncbi:uncharacterized protein [Onthophagus taurus]|uniref:uncharacterized protein n=1 Tax=Onthophagus taurus TaxID=166361 RepID=UPI000C20EAD7|nr:uncharacterized protein LOC111423482 [Onthophagus taurus]